VPCASSRNKKSNQSRDDEYKKKTKRYLKTLRDTGIENPSACKPEKYRCTYNVKVLIFHVLRISQGRRRLLLQ